MIRAHHTRGITAMNRPLSLLLLAAAAAACAPETSDPAGTPFGADPAAAQQEGGAWLHVEQMAQVTGLNTATLVKVSEQKDWLNMTHAKFRQEIDGVPVFGGRLTVHTNSAGELVAITNSTSVSAEQTNTAPAYTREEALDIALAELDDPGALTSDPTAELMLYPDASGDTKLVWKVQMERLDGTEFTSRPVRFVDAHTGEIALAYEGLQTVQGQGQTNYYGTVDIEVTNYNGSYYLEDASTNVATFTHNGTFNDVYYVSDEDLQFNKGWQPSAVEAHFAASGFLDFLSSTYGRDGIDDAWGPQSVGALSGNGGVLAVYADYGNNYANAFWDGTKVTLGTGDGYSVGALSSVDIVAHELTHGLIERTGNMIYQGEPGALNESFADVFGALGERYILGDDDSIWFIGEDIELSSSNGAFRYMFNPTLDGSSRDHYSTRYRGYADNGGVHINSGIGNLAFYLASEGGSHPTRGGRSVQGIGADAAGEIWYRALTIYMTPTTDFAGARTALLQAARDLYGRDSAEYNGVRDAWASVGIGSYSPVSSSGNSGGQRPPAEPTDPCAGYDNSYTGSLTNRGQAIEPNGSYYQASAGTHQAALSGPSNADFDLTLYRWNGGWEAVQKSESNTSNEQITIALPAGYYLWSVDSYSGSGSYQLCLTTP